MGKLRDVMVGVRVTPEMARALETARAKRGMRSISAFCRNSIENSLQFLGIPFGPVDCMDAPLFQTTEEIVARDVAPGEPHPAPELGSPVSNGEQEAPPEPKPAEDMVDLSKRPAPRKPAEKNAPHKRNVSKGVKKKLTCRRRE